MEWLGKGWRFLGRRENRTILTWLGGGVVAVAGLVGAWLWPDPPPAPPAAQPAISAPGGVAAGTISGGTFTIGGGDAPAPPPAR